MRKKNEQPKSGWIKHGWKTLEVKKNARIFLTCKCQMDSNGQVSGRPLYCSNTSDESVFVGVYSLTFVIHSQPFPPWKIGLTSTPQKGKLFIFQFPLTFRDLFTACSWLRDGYFGIDVLGSTSNSVHLLSQKHTTKAKFFSCQICFQKNVVSIKTP